MTTIAQEELDAAVEIARKAGELTLDWFRSPSLEINSKGDGTPVTEADRAAERLMREQISRRWPDDEIRGEEEQDRPGTSGRTWIIDPIDGTKAFTRGVPLYTNLLAMNDPEGPAIGVINVPALGITVWAGRGMGCFENGAPIAVSDTADLNGAYMSTCAFDEWSDEAFTAVRQAGMFLRTWGDGYGYVLVASGRVDAMVDPVVAVWDVAPAPVILSEAGGRFTDMTGEPRIDGGNGIASNGKLHEDLLALLGGSA